MDFDWNHCPDCKKLQLDKDQLLREIDTLKRQHENSCLSIKQQIISTDDLLRKYKAATDRCTELEEKTLKVDQLQRECDCLSQQLQAAFADPVRKAREKLEKEVKTLRSQLEESQAKSGSFQASLSQYQSLLAKCEQENKTLEAEKTSLKEKVKDLEASLKKSEASLKKHEDAVVRNNKRKQSTECYRLNRKLMKKIKVQESRIAAVRSILNSHGMSVYIRDLRLDEDDKIEGQVKEEPKDSDSEDDDEDFVDVPSSSSLVPPLPPSSTEPAAASPSGKLSRSSSSVAPLAPSSTESSAASQSGKFPRTASLPSLISQQKPVVRNKTKTVGGATMAARHSLSDLGSAPKASSSAARSAVSRSKQSVSETVTASKSASPSTANKPSRRGSNSFDKNLRTSHPPLARTTSVQVVKQEPESTVTTRAMLAARSKSVNNEEPYDLKKILEWLKPLPPMILPIEDPPWLKHLEEERSQGEAQQVNVHKDLEMSDSSDDESDDSDTDLTEAASQLDSQLFKTEEDTTVEAPNSNNGSSLSTHTDEDVSSKNTVSNAEPKLVTEEDTPLEPQKPNTESSLLTLTHQGVSNKNSVLTAKPNLVTEEETTIEPEKPKTDSTLLINADHSVSNKNSVSNAKPNLVTEEETPVELQNPNIASSLLMHTAQGISEDECVLNAKPNLVSFDQISSTDAVGDDKETKPGLVGQSKKENESDILVQPKESTIGDIRGQSMIDIEMKHEMLLSEDDSEEELMASSSNSVPQQNVRFDLSPERQTDTPEVSSELPNDVEVSKTDTVVTMSDSSTLLLDEPTQLQKEAQNELEQTLTSSGSDSPQNKQEQTLAGSDPMITADSCENSPPDLQGTETKFADTELHKTVSSADATLTSQTSEPSNTDLQNTDTKFTATEQQTTASSIVALASQTSEPLHADLQNSVITKDKQLPCLPRKPVKPVVKRRSAIMLSADSVPMRVTSIKSRLTAKATKIEEKQSAGNLTPKQNPEDLPDPDMPAFDPVADVKVRRAKTPTNVPPPQRFSPSPVVVDNTKSSSAGKKQKASKPAQQPANKCSKITAKDKVADDRNKTGDDLQKPAKKRKKNQNKESLESVVSKSPTEEVVSREVPRTPEVQVNTPVASKVSGSPDKIIALDRELFYASKLTTIAATDMAARIHGLCVSNALINQQIVKLMCKESGDILQKLPTDCASLQSPAVWTPVYCGPEVAIANMILELEKSTNQAGIVDTFTSCVLKTVHTDEQVSTLGKAALIRLLASICINRTPSDLPVLKVLAYDFIHNRPQGWEVLLLSVLAVCPKALHTSELSSEVNLTYQHCIQKLAADSSAGSPQRQALQQVCCLAGWECPGEGIWGRPSQDGRAVAQQLMAGLQLHACMSRKDKVHEVVRCLDLLSQVEGLNWIKSNFLQSLLWPQIQTITANLQPMMENYVVALLQILEKILISNNQHLDVALVTSLRSVLSDMCIGQLGQKVSVKTQLKAAQCLSLLAFYNYQQVAAVCQLWWLNNQQRLTGVDNLKDIQWFINQSNSHNKNQM